ncbi:MAG TPA: hypothetical protein VNG53_11640, partial [Bacteroidia bacterium]|nr:hypothetical protein [Bacteroidia bacterium]
TKCTNKTQIKESNIGNIMYSMKSIVVFFSILLLCSCNNETTNKQNASSDKTLTQKDTTQTTAVAKNQNKISPNDSLTKTNEKSLSQKKFKKHSTSKNNFLPLEHFNHAKKLNLLPSSYYVINTDSQNIIHSAKNTMIYIPNDCFVLPNGKLYKGKVKIELKEAYNLADIVLGGLSTTSDGKFLTTGGMVYINATGSNGEQLKMQKNQRIHIEIPTDSKDARMQKYSGIGMKNGGINWKQSGKLDKTLFSIPVKYLDFDGKIDGETLKQGDWTNTQIFKGDTNYSESFYDLPTKAPIIAKNATNDIISSKYDNTYIHTREFTSRFNEIINDFYCLSLFVPKPLNPKSQVAKYDSLVKLVLKVYENNINKPFGYADSIVYTIALHTWETDSLMHKYGKGTYDDYYYSVRYACNRTSTVFKNYYSEHLGEVEKFNFGVNLSLPSAYNELLKKRMSPEKAKKVLRNYKIRQGIIEELALEIKKNKNATNAQNSVFYAINVTKLGWENVDFCSILLPKKELIVSVKNNFDLNLKMVIVIPEINSVASADFTGNTCKINYLPSGMDVQLIVYGLNSKTIYFLADKTIGSNMKQNLNFQLELNEMNSVDFTKKIKELLN